MRDLAGERELDVLAARGKELERGFAFGLVRQLLDPPLMAADATARSQDDLTFAREECSLVSVFREDLLSSNL